MDFFLLILVLSSAVFHSLWNFLAKGATDKEVFMWLQNISSMIIFLPFFYFFLPEYGFPINVLPFFLISAIAESIYFIALGRAYETGDLSTVYPLARSSPIFVTIFAFFFLGESLSIWGVTGIIIIVTGVFMIHSKTFDPTKLRTSLKALNTNAFKYALLAALSTTAYSLSDKTGVINSSAITYSFWLGFFITGLLTPIILIKKSFSVIVVEAKASFSKIILSGILMKGGYILVLIVMGLVEVSYVLALRQISVVFGSLLGVLILKERYGKIRLISSVLIFIGVYIIGTLT